uniref:Uncharacterized protein n=1 Tax=Arundo donax TaxID=35708 RepID=A0A0A9E9E0_ARUDO
MHNQVTLVCLFMFVNDGDLLKTDWPFEECHWNLVKETVLNQMDSVDHHVF